MKYSSKKGNFLDDNVTENSKSKVVTSLYTKPTDTYTLSILLHVTAHLVKTHYHTAKLSESNEHVLVKVNVKVNFKILNNVFLTEGNREKARKEICQVSDIEKKGLLKKKEKGNDDNVTITLTFNPALYRVVNILRKPSCHIENHHS